MSSLSMRIVCTLCLFVIADTASAQRRQTGNTMPTQRELGRYNLERAWWNQATLNPARDTVRHLTADDEIVYVQSTAGVVTAFEIQSGRKMWAQRLGRTDTITFPIASNDRIAMVAVGLQLYAVDKWSGTLLWRLRIPSSPSASPSADANNLYQPTLAGSLYAFDLRKIENLYRERLLPQWSSEAFLWRYQTAGAISTPPISNGRVVNFASMDQSLYSVDSATSDVLFQLETDAPISAAMTSAKGYLFMASEDLKLYCLDQNNGRIRWDYSAATPIQKPPQVVGGDIFLTPTRGGLHCVAVETGALRWYQPRLTEFVAAGRNRVYASDELDNLVVLARSNGAPLASLPLRKFSERYANERNDRIIVSTESGLVLCLNEKGQDFPIYHKYPERRPILPELAPENPPAAAVEQ